MPTRARLLARSLSRPISRALLALALAAGGAALAQDGDKGRSEARNGAVAIGADLAVQGATTRLTLTLSKPVEARAFVMERPDRAVIDLPEVNFQLPAETGRAREGVVSGFRYGLFAPGRSRIVLDLAGPALVDRIETTRARDGATLLTIGFRRTEREAFAKAAVAADPMPSPQTALRKSLPADPADARPLIVVDAGHGGTDPGAIARGGVSGGAPGGVLEKDVVFGFAGAFVRRLRESGRYRVLMTRDRDVFVPLAERVRIAREARADLFVSIHADSIASSQQVTGATIYTGSDKATDAESARLAERENTADAAAGTSSDVAATDVNDILQELTLRETRGFSAGFAGRLLGQLPAVMEMSGKPHRSAGFVVLRSPDVPSVLVELGYLSSRSDLEKLVSEEWRAKVTGAMAAAVDQFFAGRATAAQPAPTLAPSTTGSVSARPRSEAPALPSVKMPRLALPRG